MPRIIYIKESKGGGYVILGISDGEGKRALVVDKSTYFSLGSPQRSHELSEEEIALIEKANDEYRALKKALSLLSYSDNSERNLKMKLLRAGFSRDSSESAVREVVRLGYLKEEEQLERIICYEANSRLNGPMKIISKLSAKGYSSVAVRRALEKLQDEGHIDFQENRRILLEKKLDTDATDEEKYKLLKSCGYKAYE